MHSPSAMCVTQQLGPKFCRGQHHRTSYITPPMTQLGQTTIDKGARHFCVEDVCVKPEPHCTHMATAVCMSFSIAIAFVWLDKAGLMLWTHMCIDELTSVGSAQACNPACIDTYMKPVRAAFVGTSMHCKPPSLTTTTRCRCCKSMLGCNQWCGLLESVGQHEML